MIFRDFYSGAEFNRDDARARRDKSGSPKDRKSERIKRLLASSTRFLLYALSLLLCASSVSAV